jgi:hypothetical protein
VTSQPVHRGGATATGLVVLRCAAVLGAFVGELVGREPAAQDVVVRDPAGRAPGLLEDGPEPGTDEIGIVAGPR